MEKLAMGAAIRMFLSGLLETAQKIARVAQRPFVSDGYITGWDGAGASMDQGTGSARYSVAEFP